MKAAAVIPVKRFGAAKARLAPGVDEERRRALVAAMLSDVLEALQRSRMVDRMIVVTGEEEAAGLAAEAGAEVIDDPDDAGHSEAALRGVEGAVADGVRCVALLPGDCPLLEPRELDGILTGVPDRYVAIVPDRHGSGTNALILSPPHAIHPAFGEGSRERHVESARAAEIPYSVEEVPSLALDLDTPADVLALTTALEFRSGSAPRTAKVLGLRVR
ncbi:MAG TPA: 2-phospho-L-lactate guanylyltransferase [Solirubrobacterales bacterium]|nr:2-phospho-L-lactate guanylyltransferase [Solirubrobacterales bacterium]